MNNLQKYLSTCLLGIAALLVGASPAWAQTAPSLGTASSFGALGGAGVTCTTPNPPLPAITVTGDVGAAITGTDSVTGFPGFTPGANPCSLSGTVQLGAAAARSDVIAASNALASIDPIIGFPCPADAAHNLSGDLKDTATRPSLPPGVYCISGVGLLTGTLTLNGGGNSNAVWIFKAESSITPMGGATPALRSTVVMANGGQACNVYWRTVSAATFSNTDFVGNVLAGSAITFTGSTLAGRALALSGSVTMTGSSISSCGGTQPPPPPPAPSCDKDHKHHKHGEQDGRDQDGHDQDDQDQEKHDKQHRDGDHDGHDQCDQDQDDHDQGDQDQDHHDQGDRD